MPQQPHRDHGVTGTTHWLLDEELASLGSRRRAGTPAALRHEALEVATPTATATVAEPPPKRNFLVLVAGLVTALLVYALLSSADVVGALEPVYPDGGGHAIRIGATIEAPRAGELAELRALLAATPGATRPVAPGASSSSRKPKAPGSNPGPLDGVTPPPPPPPPPPTPIAPELPLPKVPGVEVPPRPKLEVTELEVPGTSAAGGA
jgi:hypothetical protein